MASGERRMAVLVSLEISGPVHETGDGSKYFMDITR